MRAIPAVACVDGYGFAINFGPHKAVVLNVVGEQKLRSCEACEGHVEKRAGYAADEGSDEDKSNRSNDICDVRVSVNRRADATLTLGFGSETFAK